jgi:hypothetical protein
LGDVQLAGYGLRQETIDGSESAVCRTAVTLYFGTILGVDRQGCGSTIEKFQPFMG